MRCFRYRKLAAGEEDGVVSMQAEETMARQRLSVLQLPELVGNVSAACRQREMTRAQFSDHTRRFALQGLKEMKDLPPPHTRHPQTAPPEIVAAHQAHQALNRERPTCLPPASYAFLRVLGSMTMCILARLLGLTRGSESLQAACPSTRCRCWCAELRP
jgi:hypothetical protein